MEVGMTYIYALLDPRHDSFNPKWMRYVGKADDPDVRLYEHIWESENHRDENTHKCNWIRTLLKEGLEPILKVVQMIPDNYEEAWQEAERKWIMLIREMGYELTNVTDGGEGVSGYVFTPEQKLAQRKGSEEYWTPERELARRKRNEEYWTIKRRKEAGDRVRKQWTSKRGQEQSERLLGNQYGRGGKGKKHLGDGKWIEELRKRMMGNQITKGTKHTLEHNLAIGRSILGNQNGKGNKGKKRTPAQKLVKSIQTAEWWAKRKAEAKVEVEVLAI